MLLHAVYRGEQRIARTWLRRTRRGDFAEAEAFCLFVGYPRSGHSLVGELLNAHPSAVIAHEAGAQQLILDGRSRDEIYACILARAQWFALRGSRSNYPYAIRGQWQGRYARLQVIGDKRGGAVARALRARPDFLELARDAVGIPLRLIHVAREPLDNIASIARWQRMSLAAAADHFFLHREVTAGLGELVQPRELITVAHEELVRHPAATVRELCAFLGLPADDGYVDACAAAVFPEPTRPGTKIAWPAELLASIEARCAALGVPLEPPH